LIALFRRLNEESGLTVILVTHDQDISRNANRVVVLQDGRLVADTTDFDQAIEALHSSEEDRPKDDSEGAVEESLD
jgi:ABC-type lipoprotein export system ATPase subunit